ncbi:hypothetical protein [Tepidibacter thalassicus]|uniref:hypothetical protein n=1 Tax=Tepidibacter thalassicus TaxID=214905 RepID=UPI0015B87164|nr:hypothetical protein [Tepidibacter thalassicus]
MINLNDKQKSIIDNMMLVFCTAIRYSFNRLIERMVIARRSYGFKERVPKILVDKFIDDKEKFNKYNEWKKWTVINKNIKRKVGVKPDLWLINRKKLLGIAS